MEWEGAPLRLRRCIFPEQKEGIQHLLPAAPEGPGLPRGFPERVRPQGFLRLALGQARWGQRQPIPGSRQCARRSAAAHPAPQQPGWQRRARLLERLAAKSGEPGRLQPLRWPRPGRGERARGRDWRWAAGVFLWAPALCAARSWGAEWPRTLPTSRALHPAHSGVRPASERICLLGSPDALALFPQSCGVEQSQPQLGAALL